jgi:tellurite resistance protein
VCQGSGVLASEELESRETAALERKFEERTRKAVREAVEAERARLEEQHRTRSLHNLESSVPPLLPFASGGPPMLTAPEKQNHKGRSRVAFLMLSVGCLVAVGLTIAWMVYQQSPSVLLESTLKNASQYSLKSQPRTVSRTQARNKAEERQHLKTFATSYKELSKKEQQEIDKRVDAAKDAQDKGIN